MADVSHARPRLHRSDKNGASIRSMVAGARQTGGEHRSDRSGSQHRPLRPRQVRGGGADAVRAARGGTTAAGRRASGHAGFTGNLAYALRKQGKYEEAAQRQCELLEVERQALGAEDPGTLATTAHLVFKLGRRRCHLCLHHRM